MPVSCKQKDRALVTVGICRYNVTIIWKACLTKIVSVTWTAVSVGDVVSSGKLVQFKSQCHLEPASVMELVSSAGQPMFQSYTQLTGEYQ